MEITFPCGEQFYPGFAKKRHGWTKILQIFSYFFFLLTMTFFPLNVMVDENKKDYILFLIFTTMTFCFEIVIFIEKTSWLKTKISCPHAFSYSEQSYPDFFM